MGGKKFHSKYILPFFPDSFDGYCEPFSGAFWTFLQSDMIKTPIIYNDINPHMSNLFRCASENPIKLKDNLKLYEPQSKILFEKFRDEIFDRGFDSIIETSDFEIASKFAYIQTQTFAGNTLGKKTKISILDKTKYRSKYEQLIDKLEKPKFIHKIQQITNVENLDFEECIRKYDSENMMFYIDPPYFKCEDYYTMAKTDIHIRLSKTINTMKGKVILSYYDFDNLKEWYPENKFRRFRYNINCQNGNRLKLHSSKREELLIANY